MRGSLITVTSRDSSTKGTKVISRSSRAHLPVLDWGARGERPFTIPLPDVQGKPWRFGRRQRLSVASPAAYRPIWPALPSVQTKLNGGATTSFRVAIAKLTRPP